VIVVREQRVFDRHAGSVLKAQSNVRSQRGKWRHSWLFILCVLGSLCAFTACGRTQPPPPSPPLVPQLSGTIAVAGLSTPVRIVRDRWGVPHIYARSEDDLFFAQGFVQAQDRLFQMDLWRRSAQGRLSEALGPNFIERDAMTRRVQYRGDPDAEWASYGPDAKTIAEAFVRGVNAWVTLARERPPEEFVLAGWKPELWSPDDLLNRTEAFTASGDAFDEIFRARLAATVGAARARLLLPDERAFDIPAELDVAAVPDLVADAIRRVGTPPFFMGLAAPVAEGPARLLASVRSGATARSSRSAERGDWQPDRDPVRTLDHPSLRYFVHLNAPGWNVIGATAPWRPGVAVGHNDRIAWTGEPFGADTQDVYVEKLRPSNPHQVQDGGRWVDVETRKDWIAVRGRKTPVDFERETTRHGVIVASDRERHLAFAVRWSGSEPGAAAELAAPALDRATSWPQFRSALARWKMPSRRVTYADADGRRGFQVAALVPVRRGWNGAIPVPGWTAVTEWIGWRTLDDLPHAISPSTSFGTGRSIAPGTSPRAASAAPPSTLATQMILEAARLRPDRADALLTKLAAVTSSPDSLKAQRAAIVDALAEALRERSPSPGGPVLFTHPLGVTDAARRRFNVTARAPAGAAAEPFAMIFNPTDWDRSMAISAPGQSGSPESAHFADLVKLWSAGEYFPLAFTERAVQANTEATLTLTPK
jgi:acyl-homoserine lactone acylase PvdQ